MIKTARGLPVEISGLKLAENHPGRAVLLVRLPGDGPDDVFPISVCDLTSDEPHEVEFELIRACGRNLRGEQVDGDALFNALRARLAGLRRAGAKAYERATAGGLTANASAVVALADITDCCELLGLFVGELRSDVVELRRGKLQRTAPADKPFAV
ncbi:MAG: hypothetical protein E6R03_04830 [Hyphomicrobiaceae bacterium]|nr:MAG: hypothetical protein E6R03_04830 [Hyphomicrobiaceae bacterium]